MPQATATRQKAANDAWKRRESVCFEYATNDAGRVDRAQGVIYGVKVLGVQSKNKAKTIGYTPAEVGAAAELPYSYTVGAMEDALGMYEGAVVYQGHVDFKRGENGSRQPIWRQRDHKEALGTIKNVRVVKDGPVEKQGIYGDFHVLKDREIAESIFDDAERKIGVYKLSHEGLASHPALIEGRVAMTKISKVAGIALITQGAGTARNMFESQDEAPATIREILLAASAKHPSIKAVLEDFGAAPIMGQPMTPPTGAAATSDAMAKEALGQVLLAYWNDDTLDKNAKLAKFRLILGFMDKSTGMPGASVDPPLEEEPPVVDAAAGGDIGDLGGGDEGETKTTDEGGGGPPFKKKKKSGDESEVEEDEMSDANMSVAIMESIDLLEAVGIPATRKKVAFLSAIKDSKERKAMAEEYAADLKAARDAAKPVAESDATKGRKGPPAPIPLSQLARAPKPVAESRKMPTDEELNRQLLVR